MSFKLTLVAAAVIGLSACNMLPSESNSNQSTTAISVTETEQASVAANRLFDDIFEAQVARSPLYLSYLGRKTDNDKWDNLTHEYAEETLALTKRQLRELTAIDTSKLDPHTLVSYQLLKQQLEEEIADHQWRLYNYPVNQMFGVHSRVPSVLINQHQIDTIADAKAYIKRIQAIPTYFSQLADGLSARADAGIIAPKFVFPHVVRTSQNIIKGQPFSEGDDSAMYADFKAKVGKLAISDEEKSNLIDQAKAALLTSAKPAYQNLISYLNQLAQRADDKDGVWKFPNGEAYFNNALKRTTTTDLTAEQIHQIGLDEVKRIHNEMRTIKDKVGFKGDLTAFMAFMRSDKQFYYSNTPEGKQRYLDEATALIDVMKTRLDELFITKPKADLIVKAVEPFREQAAGKAFYQQPAEDGSRPGIYYANLYDMNAMPTYQMEALAYHEGAPGHHMQLAISLELEDMPKFRRFGRYTAYIEGWGLYSEYIPKEVGLYSDPYSDFGRLALELWRACRLVVDTGIHAMKWTREQGINYYKDNTPNAEIDAIKMVERHIVMPSQATAYKIGMLKILALREQAKAQLNDQFDIREFHDVILKHGAVPLNVLEDNINAWVASKS